MSVHFVAFFLDVPEVLGMQARLSQTRFVAVQNDVIGLDASRYLFLLAEEGDLMERSCSNLTQQLAGDTWLSILVVME